MGFKTLNLSSSLPMALIDTSMESLSYAVVQGVGSGTMSVIKFSVVNAQGIDYRICCAICCIFAIA